MFDGLVVGVCLVFVVCCWCVVFRSVVLGLCLCFCWLLSVSVVWWLAFVVCRRLRLVCCCLLFGGCWLSVVGYWLLVVVFVCL